ncbi:PucR family transcriptional regulator [Hathewaya histolytica]|uniref:Transcriptional regulatory protein n=1 Tax=Hathewaya histolytica TaxID=1498 RepID=A0A4U9R5T7_HATHI|nr:PucR family transcriptional regulator [Hathewaya histolytica]VTQ84050.1 transcriptional regulatory protein [Hathewaya histolytica]
MTLCCGDLFELSHFSRAKLLAGEDGLNREISWPYARMTESISEWLYGGELLFVTYNCLEEDSNSMLSLLEECIYKKLSGVVILIDDKYIDRIEKKIIDRANEENLPLFIMPWDIKLIDIIQEIFLKMEQKKEESKNAKHFLEALLFSRKQIHQDIQALGEFYNIKLRPFYYICIFKMESTSNIYHGMEEVNKHIVSSLKDILNYEHCNLVSMEYRNHLTCLIFTNDYEEAKKSSGAVEAIFNLVSSRYSSIEFNLGFSRIRETDSEIKISYKEAFKALSMINIYNKNSKVIRYNELGIVRLLVELADIKDIDQYCYENLGPILEYDKKHGVDLLGTLKCYFQNNKHLMKTSQELFIHRNTLIYRLSTIKDLLQRDLDDAMTDLELFNSILIYEFLGLKNKI